VTPKASQRGYNEIRTAPMMVILTAMQTVTPEGAQTEIRTAPMMVNLMATKTVILKGLTTA
jgi:hypothetical protein